MPRHALQQVYQQVSHEKTDAENEKCAEYQDFCSINIKWRGIELNTLKVKPVHVNGRIDDRPEYSNCQHHFYTVPACNIEWYANAKFHASAN